MLAADPTQMLKACGALCICSREESGNHSGGRAFLQLDCLTQAQDDLAALGRPVCMTTRDGSKHIKDHGAYLVGLSGLGSWAGAEPPRRLDSAAMAARAAFFWDAEF